MVSADWKKNSNPKRFGAVLRGETPDRVCNAPQMYGHCAKVLGAPTLGDYYSKPEFNLKADLIATEMYDVDTPLLFFPFGRTTGEWGGQIEYPYRPKMGMTKCVKEAIQTPAEIETHPIPDVKNGPYMKEYYQALKMRVQLNYIPVAIMRPGSFTSACLIYPIANLMLLAYRKPDLVHKLFEKLNEWNSAFFEELMKQIGIDIIFLESLATDSNILISPEIFAKFTLKHTTECHKKSLKMGFPMWWTHWCGDHNNNMKAGHCDNWVLGDPGIHWFGPEVPMKSIVERLGNTGVIMGNVDPVSIFTQPFEKVVELCRENIEAGTKAKKGYMLNCGCELPPPAPPANVYAFTKAAKEYKP